MKIMRRLAINRESFWGKKNPGNRAFTFGREARAHVSASLGGQSDERDATATGVVGRGRPTENLSAGGRADRHGRPSVVADPRLEQQFRPPGGRQQVRVHEPFVGRRAVVRAAVVPPPTAEQLDRLVAVRAHPEQVVRRAAVRTTKTQRDGLVDARRPPLQKDPQPRRVPPLRQHVQPVDATDSHQQRLRIVARATGHVAQIGSNVVVLHITPRARHVLCRVPTVIGRRRRRRPVREDETAPVRFHRTTTALYTTIMRI